MRPRLMLFTVLLLSCAGLTLAGRVSAEGETKTAPQQEGVQRFEKAEPARKSEQVGALLGNLFRELHDARDAGSAKPIEQAIWGLWLKSGSDTADLLMSWAVESMSEKNYDRAIEYLDAVIELRPGYAEAWNKRATIHYMRDDYGRSLSDIRRVLALEPRHFGALAGLGAIFQEIGQKPRALEAFRRALGIHPHLEGAKTAVERLSVEVEGRDI